MQRLTGRVALITGAASGIGRATAQRLAEEGASVVLTDVQDEAGAALAERLREQGRSAVFVHHDVADERAWQHAVNAAARDFGGLDILVNNAGIGDTATIGETRREDFERTIAVDEVGVFLGMKAAEPLLRRSAHAAVVNIGSIFGESGGFGASPAYHAAKGGVQAMSRSTALHWAQDGIRVNTIDPGFIDTPLLDQVRGTPLEGEMLARTPLGRLGRPEEIAAGVAFLASDDASFVTGTELRIDGGYLAR